MKSFFSQTRNSNHHFNPPHDSFSRSSVNKPDKRSIRVTKNIKDDIAALYQNGIGLQSILRNDGSHVIDRTRIEEDDGCIPCRSDTKSTQSESRSLKTYMSSATSNGVNSRQSNTDIMTPASINDEDMIQKYYFELRNSLKSCLSTKQPSVYFKDIAGNTYAKKVIQEAFVLSNLPSDGLKGKHKSCNKILLYGPPGVGKTMMARAVAKEAHATILWVSLADITSKFMTESEKLLRMLFELARERSPSVIIIDEMDSLGRIRNANESDTERRIKIEFLKQMDEISNGNDNVYVLATTNMPWELDIAALRRFEGRILLPMPDRDARFEILKLSVGDHPHELTDEDFKCLATLMNGYTGSDISNVVKDALMKPAKMLHETSYFKKVTTKLDNQTEELFYMPCCKEEVGSILMDFIDISRDKLIFRKVNLSDFKESVKNCSPTVSSSALSLYNKFLSKYGNVEQKEDLTTEEKDYEHFYL